jgi:hypothetical protein
MNQKYFSTLFILLFSTICNAQDSKCLDYNKFHKEKLLSNYSGCPCLKRKRKLSFKTRKRFFPFCEAEKVIAFKFESDVSSEKIDSCNLSDWKEQGIELNPKQLDGLTNILYNYGSFNYFFCADDFGGTGYFFTWDIGFVCLNKKNEITYYYLFSGDTNTRSSQDGNILFCKGKYKLLKKFFDSLSKK